jgi:hypothetical protein
MIKPTEAKKDCLQSTHSNITIPSLAIKMYANKNLHVLEQNVNQLL